MSDTDIILGIDLGTTFSAMAYVDRHGKPVIIPNSEGQVTTPSVIHFYGPDACVVGEEAIKAVVLDPDNIVRFVKRHMGEPDYALEYYGQTYSAQELSALILKKLKEDAEAHLGFEVRDVVITVPAYFNSPQRGATHEAGRLAGFNVLSIINEPTAAAMSYGVERLGGHRRMLVFDLGGGTFDVTVMEINGNTLQTLATDGNAELGGRDWDDRLLQHIAERFNSQFGMDPLDDPQVHQELYERVLSAKIALSTKPKVVITVNYGGHRASFPVTREEFEEMTRDLVQQCSDLCTLVLERARLRWADIDDILFAGGSTKMPMIHNLICQLSGRAPVPGINPDECVAGGAALTGIFRHRPQHPAILRKPNSLAHALAAPDKGTPALPNLSGGVNIIDVSSHPLGIIAWDKNHVEQVVILIPQGVPLPVERRRRFGYANDNSTALRVEVTEGAGESRIEVTVIGEVILNNLPPRPRGAPIDVVYRYTINNLLEVDVIDVETRTARRVQFNLKGSLSSSELDKATRRVAGARVQLAGDHPQEADEPTQEADSIRTHSANTLPKRV